MNISPPNILRLATSRLLVLVTLFACAFLPVHAASLDDLGYTTTDGKVTITDCDEAATGELVIPPTIEGNPVTSIGDGAFGNCFTLTNITLPDSVVSIGDYAIAGCFSLASITIGDGVISIGESAFRGSRLKSITIPNSVTSIGNQAFTQCFSLASITIGSGVTSIGNSAFRDCTSLTSITFLGTAPEADSSFSNVADGAVAYVNSEALSSFSENGDNWNGLILESRNPNETSLTWSTDNGEVTITNCDEAAGGELVIPSTIEGKPVTSIGERAFEDCIRLTSISLGSGITSIGERAFSNCSQLRSINIPAGVTAIKYYTFLYCTKLNSVSFEANSELSSIGINAFQNCESLRSITIPDGVIEIRDVAFQNCHSLTTIALPNLITVGVIWVSIVRFDFVEVAKPIFVSVRQFWVCSRHQLFIAVRKTIFVGVHEDSVVKAMLSFPEAISHYHLPLPFRCINAIDNLNGGSPSQVFWYRKSIKDPLVVIIVGDPVDCSGID
ncbi:leucine-rich repeat domain-containing protein [Akkermansiaceae bacterium]|nr:leucine-rich repeat domain-containing protein [Akkermansiaceae bacterium]